MEFKKIRIQNWSEFVYKSELRLYTKKFKTLMALDKENRSYNVKFRAKSINIAK